MFHLRFSSVLVSVATGESSGRYGNGQHTFLGELTFNRNGQLFRYKHVVGFTFDIWLLTSKSDAHSGIKAELIYLGLTLLGLPTGLFAFLLSLGNLRITFRCVSNTYHCGFNLEKVEVTYRELPRKALEAVVLIPNAWTTESIP